VVDCPWEIRNPASSLSSTGRFQMRRRYSPGEAVPHGTYVSGKTWEIVQVSRDGEPLPGGEGAYYRTPLPLLLVLGPIVGLAFIVFLPFAVPALLVYRGFAGALRKTAWARHRATQGHTGTSH
jgi:hypothetical protein